ncbi:uncharacterized protein LOC126838750 isoform X2 [Adelges cooleyi]|uniref:uncharacterized protein LOC126838750 isoform X2 n=1 Tax=Adelges cooleyi TaxID=133065 RepID=UPI00217F2DC3|nr:uncharacterized protein LOC126838750 isoform X2 [Adelges cooleyi]
MNKIVMLKCSRHIFSPFDLKMFHSNCILMNHMQKPSKLLHSSRLLVTHNISTKTTPIMNNIDFDKLLVLINLSTLIIDVREKKELAETGVLPNSINIPSSEFEKLYKIPKPDPEKSEIVFSCLAGVRSQKAVTLAQKVGYKKVYNYIGGWSEWAEKNLDTLKKI